MKTTKYSFIFSEPLADLFLSSCPLQDCFRHFMNKKVQIIQSKFLMQNHKGFVDIAEWLNIQLFSLILNFYQKAALNI